MSWDWEKLKQQQQKMGGAPPQMDDVVEKLKNINFPGGPIFVIIAVLLGFIGFSMFYTVAQDEVGVVQRFGKYVRTEQPGLNYKLPIGIEKVTKVPVTRIKTEEFGFRSIRGTSSQRYTTMADNTSLMLTGDLNVALVPWIVQYRISNAKNWLFKVEEKTKLTLLKDMSEASMRLVVGDRSITEVINKREEFAEEAKKILQTELDKAETGIFITTIEMKKTNVPEPVQPSFNEVNEAVQEKEQMIYKANEDYNRAIPNAMGEAERTIQIAKGYAVDRINRAKGDVARFNLIYKEYSKAREITRRRLYLEMIKDLYPRLDKKFIIDADQKNLLPLLNLGMESGAIK